MPIVPVSELTAATRQGKCLGEQYYDDLHDSYYHKTRDEHLVGLKAHDSSQEYPEEVGVYDPATLRIYFSLGTVPAGTALTNTTYWAVKSDSTPVISVADSITSILADQETGTPYTTMTALRAIGASAGSFVAVRFSGEAGSPLALYSHTATSLAGDLPYYVPASDGGTWVATAGYVQRTPLVRTLSVGHQLVVIPNNDPQFGNIINPPTAGFIEFVDAGSPDPTPEFFLPFSRKKGAIHTVYNNSSVPLGLARIFSPTSLAYTIPAGEVHSFLVINNSGGIRKITN